MMIRVAAGALMLAALVPASVPSDTAAASTASATGHDHYNEAARRVAREISCRRIDVHGALTGYHDAATCYLGGERVSLITFRSAAQQRRFKRSINSWGYGANSWWASGKGAIVLPDDTREKDVARLAARRLPGVLKHQ